MSLPKTLAEDVAKNLVMVARLIDEDPEGAYGYSRVALRLASRVAAVREAAGFAAYATQKYAEALAEFRAARRMTGGVELWPVMADCERGLGRPEKALDMAGAPEVHKLDRAGQVEMRLVAAGARRDMGQLDAAIVTLQSPELASHSVQSWTARLRYAYADALLAAGREDEAREWFAKALSRTRTGRPTRRTGWPSSTASSSRTRSTRPLSSMRSTRSIRSTRWMRTTGPTGPTGPTRAPETTRSLTAATRTAATRPLRTPAPRTAPTAKAAERDIR